MGHSENGVPTDSPEAHTIRNLWHLWAISQEPAAIDALDAAAAIVFNSIDALNGACQELLSISGLVGEEQFAQRAAIILQRLETAVKIGAIIGYSVAKTHPTTRCEAINWPDRAIAYAGLRAERLEDCDQDADPCHHMMDAQHKYPLE